NLRSARLPDGKCRNVIFECATMLFAECPRADFRGANLSGADLRGAVLGGVRFNNETRLEGANLTDASMDDSFIRFASRHGAILGPPSGTDELAQFVATIEELERTNDRHQFNGVLAEMYRLRAIMARDPFYDWSSDLAGLLPPALMEEVLEAVREATSNM
ncbi:MAG: pentapeptide repeat-containing protein, partial [Chloroflexota bacterium]